MEDLRAIINDESAHPDVKFHTSQLITQLQTHTAATMTYVFSIQLPLFKNGDKMPYLLGREKDVVDLWGIPILDVITSTTFNRLPSGLPAFHEPPTMNSTFVLDISKFQIASRSTQSNDETVHHRS